ncbi:DUF4870 domain-containing protein [Pseudoalteromonas shioyasakiensis]|uniref:DUF4870 domain-containing protein n=1 Tax=Pseudoalteromonas TaxID=53246 RepID=UPI000C995739|nr:MULTISPECIES: DUF4870 domain-containing protein [Pseudoalteromonas]MAD02557.1 orotate phosphoribosyltransferase [Pseudoalteromonas sp.]MCG9707643.1 DUF4870 domain-containing protein [Pseudoalteromonas sp. Isolate3]MCP4584916.1 DUF4870 domain-containing protein [Pseudoalteromonas sp.]MCQ8883857.1 DUF4870 domain-containing protein [Pseudoalteromonas shioyasakiensis]QLE07979.1 DUF4870 domain-containing protein [Pseudoalteromonas shioyasakiensis]|tara:strand:- start:100 stop:471 length:372 start_codon:yes stop_codon:yes gene_type:complete|eukprot:gnl/Carplike_NY0171/10844_a15372_177.p1 GENE.gnl/Carplike_NY0171/10844_a15372_177~~gnl/Carplike_NY0171/10844_a15372_177.p1  ORF type:complete len:134 (+),score=5.38 gnl/Carplike_NY0171/10844_a15372_177:32-403(+)
MDDNQKVEIIVADKEQRMWAMFCHLSALAGLLFPFGSVIGPLIVWLVKKEEMPLVAEHGRKSLNFQLTMMIAYIVCFMLMFVVIGVILLPLVALFSLIMVVVSAIKANDGKEVKYPMAIEFIK